MIHDIPDRHLYNPQLRNMFDAVKVYHSSHINMMSSGRGIRTPHSLWGLFDKPVQGPLEIPTADHPVRCLTSTYALTWIQSYDQRGSVISQLYTSLTYVSMHVH